jgi:hypothetical protein
LNKNLEVLGAFLQHGDVSMNAKLSVLSDVSLNKNLEVLGAFLQHGDVSMNAKLSVLSDVSLNSNLEVLGSSINHGSVAMDSTLLVGGDVSMNSRLSVANDVSLNGNVQIQNLYVQNSLTFGSVPVTKFYNWTGSYNLTRGISESTTISLLFTNPFYTKIHMFSYTNTNPANSASQIVEFQGGYLNNATLSQNPNNIIQLNRYYTNNNNYNYTWNNPVTDKSNIQFTITSQNNNIDDVIYFVLRVEVIQTNNSISYPPYLNSITITDSSNNNVTTNYDEITRVVNF